MDYLIRYAHFLGLMLLFATLVASHLLTARTISGRQARRLALLDRIAGLAVVLVLASGVLMVLGSGFGKGAAYYLHNGVFHAKATLFALVLALAVKPLLFFRRHARTEDAASIAVPGAIIMLQRIQLLILLVLPLLGLLMARGVGAAP
jgi:putative membrane protein